MIDGYFKDDLSLVNLIESKQIEKLLKKFKTMSSYPYYIYDDEFYHESIYLKSIGNEDRYKGLDGF